MKLSYRKGFIDRESYITQFLGLSIFTSGVASTLGVDDLLAAFAAGQRVFVHLLTCQVSLFERLCHRMGWPFPCPDSE